MTSQQAKQGGDETILLVEDDDGVRRLVTQLVERLGYTVLTAPDSDAALETSEHHDSDIHLLLTDLVLPGLDGRGLAAKLKETRPEIRVLLMTGQSEDIMATAGIFRDGVHFLPKPFEREDLARKIREALDDR